MGLIATAPANESLVPSVITSVIQLTDANSAIPFAELISSETQLGDKTSKAITLNAMSSNNVINRGVTAKNGAIKYNESGLYFAIACAQVGSDIGTHAEGELHLWTRLNGKDIPNSNTIQTIRNGNTAVLISQGVMQLKANDKLQLMFSTTNKKLGIIASAPRNESAAPSMQFSTFRLDSKQHSIPYAQLSSLKTQWGCLTPQAVQLDSDDGSAYITNNNGIIEFQKAGIYFLIAAAQVGSYKNQGTGDVHLWMRLNGIDMPNSNTIQTVDCSTAVLICQTVIPIQIGDQVQLMISADVDKWYPRYSCQQAQE